MSEHLPYFLAGFIGAHIPSFIRWVVRSVKEHNRIVDEKHLRGIK